MNVPETILNQPMQRVSTHLACKLGNDTVLLDSETGKYFQLNSVGSHIWDLLEKPKTGIEIIEILTGEYDEQPTVIKEEALDFFHLLSDKQLILQ